MYGTPSSSWQQRAKDHPERWKAEVTPHQRPWASETNARAREEWRQNQIATKEGRSGQRLPYCNQGTCRPHGPPAIDASFMHETLLVGILRGYIQEANMQRLFWQSNHMTWPVWTRYVLFGFWWDQFTNLWLFQGSNGISGSQSHQNMASNGNN